MSKILHILRSEPDEVVTGLVAALSKDEGTTAVCLYSDSVSKVPVDWNRLLDDIFSYDQIICWW